MANLEGVSLSFIEELEQYGYQFVRKIGDGGFANVFLVYSSRYNEFFAVKQSKIGRSDLFQEHQTLIQLDHPNVIRIYSYQTIDSLSCIFFEYCKGGSLDDIVKSNHHIDPPQLYFYCYQIALAVQYLHSKNIAHHDIKPANVLIDNYGRLKLIDFGMANNTGEVNSTAGTAVFLAPEILSHHSLADPFKADIFAMGVTFYILACGDIPWYNHQNLDDLYFEMTQGCIQLSGISDPDFSQMIRHMLEPNFSLRISLELIIANPVFSQASLTYDPSQIVIQNPNLLSVPLKNSHKNITRRSSCSIPLLIQSSRSTRSIIHPRNISHQSSLPTFSTSPLPAGKLATFFQDSSLLNQF